MDTEGERLLCQMTRYAGTLICWCSVTGCWTLVTLRNGSQTFSRSKMVSKVLNMFSDGPTSPLCMEKMDWFDCPSCCAFFRFFRCVPSAESFGQHLISYINEMPIVTQQTHPRNEQRGPVQLLVVRDGVGWVPVTLFVPSVFINQQPTPTEMDVISSFSGCNIP
jgi:hypothetical protein